MTVTFTLPRGLEATAPPARRNGVRLLVASPARIRHVDFDDLGAMLEPGDLVVINTSATLAAAVDGERADGRTVTVHFATDLRDGTWVVEVRPRGAAHGPVHDVARGERITLDGGVELHVRDAHPAGQSRLWRAGISVEAGVPRYLARWGRPIRYAYVRESYPLEEYQTVFARVPGSAEMPSAGRPFTAELVTDLVSRGIGVVPITLHTGVSSQDEGEPPQPEWFEVPQVTARAVTATRANGGRVVAVGTTVTRALESAVGPRGEVRTQSGWTDLVLTADEPARVVTGLITGWHAPGASHLQLLQAVAGEQLVADAYAAALREEYLWHEFGDSCLLLPDMRVH